MWPWRRKIEVLPPDDGLYGQVMQLAVHVRGLSEQIAAAHEAVGELRRLDRKLGTLATSLDQLSAARTDDAARLANVVARVDGMRGGRPGRGSRAEAHAEVGERFLAALQDPEATQSLIAELQSRVSGGTVNGHGASPVSIAPSWNPRG